MKISKKKFYCWKILRLKSLILKDYWIQLIRNISENKVDFLNFPNFLDKVKYLETNLNINSQF